MSLESSAPGPEALALLFGAVISLFAIPAAFFVRRPSGAHNQEVGHEASLLAAEGEHAAV